MKLSDPDSVKDPILQSFMEDVTSLLNRGKYEVEERTSFSTSTDDGGVVKLVTVGGTSYLEVYSPTQGKNLRIALSST